MKPWKIVAATMLAAIASSTSAAGLKVGRPVPNAELVLVDGKHVHLADLRGQVVMLNYWATWCAPCRKELPLLNGYYEAASQRGWSLKIFAVATEDSIPKYQLKHLFSVMTISPTDRIRGGPFANFDGLPMNYVIDKRGILRYANEGAFDLDTLNEIVGPLLSEPGPSQ